MKTMKTNLRHMLLQSGCAVALIAGIANSAQAQWPAGLLNVGVTGITGGGGFGVNGKAWVPFLGFAGFYLEGGFQDHDPFVDVGFGSRFMLGNNLGIGGLVTFATQRGHDSHDQFYSIKPTLEVGLGNLTLGATFNVPIGSKEHKVKNSGSAQGQLRNKPGTTTCDPTTPTANKVCDLWLVGRENSVEQNHFGVDLNAQYELSLSGFSITPQVGVYVYDRQGKNLVGVHGGVDVGFNIGYGLTVDVSAGFRHDNKNRNYDNDHRTQGVFTGGLTWHFGGNSATASSRFVDRAPLRTVYDRGIRSHQQLGNSFEERARLQDSTSTVAVDRVEFVDSSVGNPTAKIDTLGKNRVIIVQGNIILGNATVSMDTNTAVIGGGSKVAIVGVTSGHEGTFYTPGARGVVTQNNNLQAIFAVGNRNNVLFQGLDIQSNGTAQRGIVFLINADNGRVRDVSITNVANQGVLIFAGSDGTLLSNVRISQAGAAGNGVIDIRGSQNTRIEGATIEQIDNNAIGILLNNADHTFITGANISDDNGNSNHGVFINNGTQDVILQNSSISNVGGAGIRISGATTNNIRLLNLQITAGNTTNHGINIVGGADDVLLSNVNIIGANLFGTRAVRVGIGSQNIQFQNVHAQNWRIGFELNSNLTKIVDLGGNSFTAVGTQQACDNNPNVVGGINVTTTNTGVATLCR